MSEDIARRIEETCKLRGITVNKLLTDCGLHGRVVDQMKNRGSIPSADKMVKIATHLGVSTEYLITGNEPTFTNNGVAAVQGYNYGHASVSGKTIQTSSDEKKELNRIYETLNPRRRVKLMALAFDLDDEEKENELLTFQVAARGDSNAQLKLTKGQLKGLVKSIDEIKDEDLDGLV